MSSELTTGSIIRPENFVPSFQEAIGDSAMRYGVLWQLAMEVKEDGDYWVDAMDDRRNIMFTDGENMVSWTAESLESLFRGDAVPPTLGQFPQAYIPVFALIEKQVLVYSDIFGDPTDEEMAEVYSNLARMPDGKGRSLIHEHMWQACALALAITPFSKAEFQAVIRRLKKSCRTFRLSSSSVNYMNVLRNPGADSSELFAMNLR
jgi:hypothetical protein